MTDVIELATTIQAPRPEVFAVVSDVGGWTVYSDHVTDVTREGDGGPGTEYGVTLSWWRLAYTVRFRLADVDPPARVRWRVVADIDASATCHLEPADVDDPEVADATRVVLTARYDPDSADDDALSLPPFVPVSSVVERARPFVEREAERVLSRIVADLEGEPRRATLTVRTRSEAGRGR